MLDGKTKSGFKFKIDERISSDWRLIQAIADAESEDSSKQIKGTTKAVELIFGNDVDKLMEHIAKKNDGFVPVEAVTRELVDAISSIKSTKNS